MPFATKNWQFNLVRAAKADPKNAPVVRRIDGMGSVEDITARALQALADC